MVEWKITVGNIIALAAFIITLVTLHRSNLRHAEEQSATMARIELKLDTIWKWWIERSHHERDA